MFAINSALLNLQARKRIPGAEEEAMADGFCVGEVASASGRAMLFSNPDLLRELLLADSFCCDGTFRVAPTGFTQVYTIFKCREDADPNSAR